MLQSNRFMHALSGRVSHMPLCTEGTVPVIQFGDFESRDCGRMALALNSFRHRHEGIIDFSYKHFPVSAWRRHGFKAAEAAECARAQGRFWPMHDMLIANQDRLSLRHLSEYAESIGLDMGRFGREMEAGSHSPTIRSHIYRGTLAGVRRTPTYFVAGILVDPAGGLRSLFDASQHVLAQRRGAAHPVN